MKNNFKIFLFIFNFFQILIAENLLIKSKNITLDKDREISIFKDEIFVQTDENHIIESDYAEYDKKMEL